MEQEFGICVDELDQSEEEALVSVEVRGFVLTFKAGALLPYEGQTLQETTQAHQLLTLPQSTHQ